MNLFDLLKEVDLLWVILQIKMGKNVFLQNTVIMVHRDSISVHHKEKMAKFDLDGNRV